MIKLRSLTRHADIGQHPKVEQPSNHRLKQPAIPVTTLALNAGGRGTDPGCARPRRSSPGALCGQIDNDSGSDVSKGDWFTASITSEHAA